MGEMRAWGAETYKVSIALRRADLVGLEEEMRARMRPRAAIGLG